MTPEQRVERSRLMTKLKEDEPHLNCIKRKQIAYKMMFNEPYTIPPVSPEPPKRAYKRSLRPDPEGCDSAADQYLDYLSDQW